MEALERRLHQGEVIILDGGIGSELQNMGVAMDKSSWAATALETHADTVRQLHQDYIASGADIITTNTYSAARHNLEAAGLGEKVRELNRRAVQVAQEAAAQAADVRRIYIAGTLSNFGVYASSRGDRPLPSAEQLRVNYKEQADILAEAGVDFLLLEMIRDLEHGPMLLREALTTGLPVWIGFSCRLNRDGQVKFLSTETPDRASDIEFAEALPKIMSIGGSVVAIMHSEIADTTPSLKTAMEKWEGPLGAYPNSGHWFRPYWQSEAKVTPQEYLSKAERWVEMGVQIIGGCCGIGREHIKVLREGLPQKISKP